MAADTKQNCLALLNKLDPNDPIVRVVRDFVESYDGTNYKELELLCLSLVGLILQVDELNLVSAGYDKLVQINEEVNAEIEELRENWKAVQADGVPEPPVASGLQG